MGRIDWNAKPLAKEVYKQYPIKDTKSFLKEKILLPWIWSIIENEDEKSKTVQDIAKIVNERVCVAFFSRAIIKKNKGCANHDLNCCIFDSHREFELKKVEDENYIMPIYAIFVLEKVVQKKQLDIQGMKQRDFEELKSDCTIRFLGFINGKDVQLCTRMDKGISMHNVIVPEYFILVLQNELSTNLLDVANVFKKPHSKTRLLDQITFDKKKVGHTNKKRKNPPPTPPPSSLHSSIIVDKPKTNFKNILKKNDEDDDKQKEDEFDFDNLLDDSQDIDINKLVLYRESDSSEENSDVNFGGKIDIHQEMNNDSLLNIKDNDSNVIHEISIDNVDYREDQSDGEEEDENSMEQKVLSRQDSISIQVLKQNPNLWVYVFDSHDFGMSPKTQTRLVDELFNIYLESKKRLQVLCEMSRLSDDVNTLDQVKPLQFSQLPINSESCFFRDRIVVHILTMIMSFDEKYFAWYNQMELIAFRNNWSILNDTSEIILNLKINKLKIDTDALFVLNKPHEIIEKHISDQMKIIYNYCNKFYKQSKIVQINRNDDEYEEDEIEFEIPDLIKSMSSEFIEFVKEFI